MSSKFVGKWDLQTSENFEEFMKALGVGMVMRKLGATTKPTIEILEKDGEYTMKSISMKTTEIKFKLGQEFDEVTVDGRECKTTFTADGNNLTQVQKPKDGKGVEAKYIRVFGDNDMKLTCTCGAVEAKRLYKRAA